MRARTVLTLAGVAIAALALFVWSGGWVQAKPDYVPLPLRPDLEAYWDSVSRLYEPYIGVFGNEPIACDSSGNWTWWAPLDLNVLADTLTVDPTPRTLDSLETEIKQGDSAEEWLLENPLGMLIHTPPIEYPVWVADSLPWRITYLDQQPDRMVCPRDSLLTEIRQGHDAERAWRRVVREEVGR